MSKQNLNPSYGISGALKIVKKGIKLKKLWPPKVEGVKNSKKRTTQCYKSQFFNRKQKFV
jgi:hypothetical protein